MNKQRLCAIRIRTAVAYSIFKIFVYCGIPRRGDPRPVPFSDIAVKLFLPFSRGCAIIGKAVKNKRMI